MLVLSYNKHSHQQIIALCVKALKAGKAVVYPTDTSYGLAVDATNEKAIKKLYSIKERGFKKPVHVIIPSKNFGKKLVKWGKMAEKLSEKFWPGALTLVLPILSKNKTLKRICGGTKYLGLRYPNNKVALELSSLLKKPITATSANPSQHLSGGFDSYSAADVIKQFVEQKFKPDIIIDAGKLKKRKPSTLVKITENNIEILRQGPVSKAAIKKVLKIKK